MNYYIGNESLQDIEKDKVFNEYNVIERAIEIIKDGGDKNPCDMGTFCPFCCIAIAKIQLDEEYGTGLDMDIVVHEVVRGYIIEHESDMPLVNAGKLIDEMIGEKYGKVSGIYKFTKEESLELCQMALEGNDGSNSRKKT